MYIHMSSTVAADINTLVTVGKDNCTVSLNDTLAFSRNVTPCHCLCRLFSYYCHCSNIIAGYMDSSCLSKAAFIKEIDSLFDIVFIL